MKLKKMTDFVLEQKELLKTYENHDKCALFNKCSNYAEFLKQPLTLGMFVPCDGNGNPIKKIEWVDSDCPIKHDNNNLLVMNLESECLFKDCKFDKFERLSDIKGNTLGYNKTMNYFDGEFKNIEDLVSLQIELTESAIKQITG